MHKENGYCEVEHAGAVIELLEHAIKCYRSNDAQKAYDCVHQALHKMGHLRGFLHGEESIKAEIMEAIKELAPQIAMLIKEAMCAMAKPKTPSIY